MRLRNIKAPRLPAIAIAAGLLAVTAACGAIPGEGDTARLVYSAATDLGTDKAGLFLADDRSDHRTRLTPESDPGASFAEWSPAGDKILFVTTFGEIWTIRPDGSEMRKLADGFDASWSPDGTEIAVAKESGEFEIVKSDDSSRRSVYAGDVYVESAPAWSPDGRELAFEESGNGLIGVISAHPGKSLRARSRDLRMLSPYKEGVFEEAPVWSPDGAMIAIIRSDEDAGSIEAWIMRADGSGRRMIARGAELVSWALDGRSLLVEAGEEGRYGTYRYPLNGGPAVRIGPAQSGLLESGGRFRHELEVDGSWAPDGEWFLFLEGDTLAVSRPDGSEKRRLTNAHEEYSPDWSPDGRSIAFTRAGADGAEVYVVGADGKDERRITDGDEPRWSPDGKSLLVVRSEGEVPLFAVVNVDPVSVQTVVTGHDPAWSPDGMTFAFVRHRAADDERAKSTLSTVRRDGTGLRTLVATSTESPLFGPPVWAPDGRSILVAETESDGSGRILRVAADGAGTRPVAKASFLDSLALSPDGERAAFVSERGIETITLAGGERTLVVPGAPKWPLGLSDLAWSPDGRQLAYLHVPSEEDEQIQLWTVDVDGSNRGRVTSPAEPVTSFDRKPG